MYHIYRFINKNNETIYIGKTQQAIGNRLGIHFGVNGHLGEDCYSKVKRIEYLVLESKIDMDILELYLIAKLKPFFNKDHKSKEAMTVEIHKELNWIVFNDDIDRYIARETKGVASPLTYDNLKFMIDAMDVLTVTGKRDKAILLVGFTTGFGRSDLMSVNIEDVKFTNKGMDISIIGEGKNKNIIARSILKQNNKYCATEALEDWLAISNIKSKAIFRGVNKVSAIGERLSPESVVDVLKKYAKLAGLDPKNYSGHSLKYGYQLYNEGR